MSTIERLQRRNKVVARIRVLKRKRRVRFNGSDETELVELLTEANENDWLYW